MKEKNTVKWGNCQRVEIGEALKMWPLYEDKGQNL
jgi:hypothetical protein